MNVQLRPSIWQALVQALEPDAAFLIHFGANSVPVLRGLEFHGRLARRDGRPANPGTYTLRFSLHADPRTRRSNWTEDQEQITVSPGGFFSVILGAQTPLLPRHFKQSPRWLSVRVVRQSEVSEENSPRSPLTGTVVILGEALEGLNRRMEVLEEKIASRPNPSALRERLDALEATCARLSRHLSQDLNAPIASLKARVDALDGEDGRLERFEDRLEDIDGADGDVVDLLERLEAAERIVDASTQEIEALSLRLERLLLQIGQAEGVPGG